MVRSSVKKQLCGAQFLLCASSNFSHLQVVIVASTLGVLLGWPVAGIAFLPFAIYILLSPRLAASFGMLAATALPALALVAVADVYSYGRNTVRSVIMFGIPILVGSCLRGPEAACAVG